MVTARDRERWKIERGVNVGQSRERESECVLSLYFCFVTVLLWPAVTSATLIITEHLAHWYYWNRIGVD